MKRYSKSIPRAFYIINVKRPMMITSGMPHKKRELRLSALYIWTKTACLDMLRNSLVRYLTRRWSRKLKPWSSFIRSWHCNSLDSLFRSRASACRKFYWLDCLRRRESSLKHTLNVCPTINTWYNTQHSNNSWRRRWISKSTFLKSQVSRKFKKPATPLK